MSIICEFIQTLFDPIYCVHSFNKRVWVWHWDSRFLWGVTNSKWVLFNTWCRSLLFTLKCFLPTSKSVSLPNRSRIWWAILCWPLPKSFLSTTEQIQIQFTLKSLGLALEREWFWIGCVAWATEDEKWANWRDPILVRKILRNYSQREVVRGFFLLY